MTRRREKLIEGKTAEELQNWTSIWADLLQVGMALQARSGMTRDPSNMFALTALWEASVVGYGRVFKTGRRQVAAIEVVDEVGPGARSIHDQITFWRDKHVAHRVTELTHEVAVRAVLSVDEESIDGVTVRYVAHEPDDFDEALASEFGQHVDKLRTRVWEGRINQLERKLMEEYAERMPELREGASYRSPHPSRGMAIDLNLAHSVETAPKEQGDPVRHARKKV